MDIALWSYNYAPEPTGIGPVSAVWADAMRSRGHAVTVVAAHPHYPAAAWGRRVRPSRERRDGLEVLRLPIALGRDSTAQRLRQELSFVAGLSAAAPLLARPDVMVAVSPSFPALVPAMAFARARRVPWALWLQDILPDAAVTTGLLREGRVLDAARSLEAWAYRSADRIVVISEAFARNLRAKGVPAAKVTRIYNPASAPVAPHARSGAPPGPPRLLVMGNIGHSQGLAEVVRAVDGSGVLERAGAVLRIGGHGVRGAEVAAAVRTDRVRLLGLLAERDLEHELRRAALGVVTQRPDIAEFNLPSKVMRYMAHGLPVLAVVPPGSETARIVRDNGAGWVADSARVHDVPPLIERILAEPGEIARRGESAHAAAARDFAPERIAERHERVLSAIL